MGNFLGGGWYPSAYYGTVRGNPVMGVFHSGGVGSIILYIAGISSGGQPITWGKSIKLGCKELSRYGKPCHDSNLALKSQSIKDEWNLFIWFKSWLRWRWKSFSSLAILLEDLHMTIKYPTLFCNFTSQSKHWGKQEISHCLCDRFSL